MRSMSLPSSGPSGSQPAAREVLIKSGEAVAPPRRRARRGNKYLVLNKDIPIHLRPLRLRGDSSPLADVEDLLGQGVLSGDHLGVGLVAALGGDHLHQLL